MRFADFFRRYKWLLLLAGVAALYYPRFIHRPQGLTFYPLGAEAMLRGVPLEVGLPTFTYPPVFAFVMIPFVFLPPWLRDLLWYLVLVISTCLSFRLCEHLTQQSLPAPLQQKQLGWLRILALALSLKLVLAVFENQSYDSVVFLCVLVGLYGLTAGNDFYASSGLALAAALKATPLLFFPYLLLRGRLKLFLLCVALYAGFSFLPDLFFTPRGAPLGYFMTWIHDLVGGLFVHDPAAFPVRQWDLVNPLNESLKSLVTHLTTGSSWSVHAKAILGIAYLGYLSVMAGLLLRSGKMEKPLVVDGSVLLISMLMLAPMSSKSHFITLMLPYMVLAAYVIQEPRFRRLGGVVLAVSFMLNTLTAKALIGKRLSEVFLSSGCVTVGTLVLLVFFGHIIAAQAKASSPATKPRDLEG
jgi:hypothetical protein